MRIGRLLGFCLLFLGSFQASASEPVNLLHHQDVMEFGKAVEYLEDAEGKLRIDDIRALPSDSWKKSQVTVPNFGLTRSAYWL